MRFGMNRFRRRDDDDEEQDREAMKYGLDMKEPRSIDGPQAVNALFSTLGRQAGQAPAFLETLSSAMVNPAVVAHPGAVLQPSQIHPAVAATISTFSNIATGLQNAQQKLEADYMRRPNQEVGLWSDVPLAPGGTKAFILTPSGGQSWYRLLQFNCSDELSSRFGFNSLKIGGMEHVISNAQTTPTVATFAVPWVGYQIRESSHLNNLQPWTGDAFDNSVTLTCTVVNMTNAAAGDAFTQAPRMRIGVQTDPCGQNYMAAKNSQRLIYQNINKRMGHLLYA